MSVKFLLLQICLILGLGVSAAAQTPASSSSASIDEKSQKIIDRALEVVGGQTYLNVQTVIGKGFYSDFKDGEVQVPVRFLDYIAYPDRERTEFTSLGIKTIQTNSGDTGWMAIPR